MTGDARSDFLHNADARRTNGGLFVFKGQTVNSGYDLDFSKLDGLLPAVIQDHETGRVLMVGFMNEEAFRRTVETGHATFYSRSRNRMWTKGESSGYRLAVKAIQVDCDRDSVLVLVDAQGPGVCHEGYQSCFSRTLTDGDWRESEAKTYDPNAVYGGAQ